jgi:hypothetical protein
VKALTTPAMEGRGSGTRGLTSAARHLEEEFERLGLDPAGTTRYFQPFRVTTGARLSGNNSFRVQSAGVRTDFKLNEDYVPFSFSSSGEAVTAPIVFAGYGITSEQAGYDDYAGLDVRDKVVLALRSEPAQLSAKLGGQGLSPNAALATKAINARNHGAKALIVVSGAMGGEDDALITFGNAAGPNNAGMLFVHAKNRIAQGWFARARKSLDQTQKQIDASLTPASFAFPEDLRVTLRVGVELTRATVNNVLAYLPGRSDEYVIIGAHYDHLGYGSQGGSLAPAQVGQIHPGADDNASGTAGLLELARLFAPLKGRLARGILFAGFASEELGLVGSAAWVESPTRPLEKAVAMLNMDMIGRIRDDKVYVGGVGTGSTFRMLLDEAREESNFQLEYSTTGHGASDHISFAGKEVPVLFFFSGLHADYHKPSDTWEKINAAGAARLLDMIADVTLDLHAAAPPEFVAVADAAGPHGGPTPASGSGSGYGAYFGSIPDFAEIETGVRFSGVTPGSPAAKAGLQAGDILVQFGDKAIRNLYDFTDALRRARVGEAVEVTVLRGGSQMKVPVTLEQRR